MKLPKITLICLFLLALAVLMVEICLTRIFSVLSWHHFAYLIISLALLGFGAAGSYLTVAQRFADEQNDRIHLGHFAWMFAVTLIGMIVIVSKIRFYPVDIVRYKDYSNGLSLLMLYIVVGIPFFFGGVCIGRMVAFAADKVNIFYFADLIGAGLGALVALVVINSIGAVAGIFLAASFVALAAWFLGIGDTRRWRWAYGATLVVALLLTILTSLTDILPFYYPPSKELFRREHEVEYSKWHVVGKVDITYPKSEYFPFGGVLSSRYNEMPPPRIRGIYQDGAAPTGIMFLQKPPEKVPLLGEYLQGIAYAVQPAVNALVIGIGGGIDGLIALHYGTDKVVGVDINPVTVDAVESRFREDCPVLWNDGRFQIKVSEGRHYLSVTDERFDVIQLSGVDTYAALSTGAYALSENFLYTIQAMHDYWQHLTDNGILSFSRWLFDPPRETLRLMTTQLKILDDVGVEHPEKHFVIVSGSGFHEHLVWAEVLLKKSAFTREQVSRLNDWARERGFTVLFDPYRRRSNIFDDLIRADSMYRKKLIAEYRFNIVPTTDDDPFFFQFYRWKSLFKMVGAGTGLASSKGGYSITRVPLGLVILAGSLVQMLVLSFIFIIAPLWMRHRLRTRNPGRLGVFVYFAALGLGFIFIEIALLQKFSVFVGGPVYSMAITLASILVFAGVGSFIAHLFRKRPAGCLVAVIVVLMMLIAGEMFFVDRVIGQLMGLNLYMRWLITILAVAPLAIVMGMPFPTGLRLLQQFDESMRPWAWGINSCATVIGSILCVLLSIHAGFTSSILAAGAIYIIGGFGLIWAAWRNRSQIAGEQLMDNRV